MLQGFKDLLGSERGVICVLLLLVSVTFVIVGAITFEQWLDYTKWIVTALVISKTVTTSVDTLAVKPGIGG